MKRFFRILSVIMTAVILTAIMPYSVFAGSFSESKAGVVFIVTQFTAPDDRSYIFQNSQDGEYYYLEAGSTVSFRGSGFAIGNEGEDIQYIVTNAHVVLDDTAEGIRSLDPLNATVNVSSKKANEVLVYFSYGANDFMRAQIYLVDEARDICVLKLPQATDKRKPLILCKSSDIDMDDDFAALGFPADSDLLMDNTALTYDINDVTSTRGAISRQTTDSDGKSVYQIDVDISPGNSGGPLVNSNGEVVGINTYSITNLSSGHSLNYAIVIDELLSIINRDVVPYTLSSEVSGNEQPVDTEPATEAAATEAPATITQAPATTTQAPAADTQAPATTAAASSNTNSDSSDSNMTIIIVVIAAVVIIAAAVAVIFALKNKKPKEAPVQQSAPAMSKTMPVQSGQSSGAVITGMKGIMANRSFNINGGLTLGRNSQKCNVCFPVDTKGISGVHCQIKQAANGGYEIVDLGSSNGTFVGNGQKLTPNVPASLPDGTYFYLGSAEQLFQIKY